MLPFMRDIAIALFIVTAFFIASGCAAPRAPRFYSIDEAFSAAEGETIRAAVEAWCEKTNDCPEESAFAEDAHFELVDDLPEDAKTAAACPEGAQCVTNGKEQGGRIRIARNRAAADDLDYLWRIVAHEYGHLCIDGHIADSALMSALQDHTGLLEVDNEAVEAWKDGCE